MGYQRDSQGNKIVAKSQYLTKVLTFAESSTENISMAVDAAADVDQNIWDGEGTYWSDPSVGSQQANSAHTGSNGWDSGTTSLGDEVMWDRGTKYDPPGDAVEMWIRFTALPSTSQVQARWEDNGTVKGSGVSIIGSYDITRDLDVWQHLSIPMSDFSLGGDDVDQFRLRTTVAAGARYDVDEVKLVTNSNNRTFQVRPGTSQEWRLSRVRLTLGSPSATGWGINDFGSVLGGLANGLSLRHRNLSGSTNKWRLITRFNHDLWRQYSIESDVTLGTVRMVVAEFDPNPSDVIIDNDNPLEMLVRDDLSGMSVVQASAVVGAIVD